MWMYPGKSLHNDDDDDDNDVTTQWFLRRQTRVAYITIAIRLRYNYDIYDYDEKLTCSFFACVELEAGARDTS